MNIMEVAVANSMYLLNVLTFSIVIIESWYFA
jgi:hypothetical protein